MKLGLAIAVFLFCAGCGGRPNAIGEPRKAKYVTTYVLRSSEDIAAVAADLDKRILRELGEQWQNGNLPIEPSPGHIIMLPIEGKPGWTQKTCKRLTVRSPTASQGCLWLGEEDFVSFDIYREANAIFNRWTIYVLPGFAPLRPFETPRIAVSVYLRTDIERTYPVVERAIAKAIVDAGAHPY